MIFKCKMCGGDLKIVENMTTCECEFCGSKQTLPKTKDDVIANLFNRANNLRLKCEFDKAITIYEKIIEKDDSEAEAHWGIVLCRYGIEYVEDPITKTRIPTCHRTLYDAVSKDIDYQAAIDYSDTLQQSIYENEARAIDKIQKGILEIVRKEDPFDVFICYKDTDENGKRTKDSVLANDIYYQLTQEGFKVFYAAITLEDKLGQEYEPYIFAALNTAKVMLVIGSKPEYFNAVWVKNEWSRFMNFMKTDRSKLLIPCYKDMDAYDLPEDFAHLQAQDMSKIGFINDVVRGIKKVIKKEDVAFDNKPEISKSPDKIKLGALLTRIELFIEDDELERADDFCEKALNIDPENATVYFYKLLMEYDCKTKEELFDTVNKMSKEIAQKYGCTSKEEIIEQGFPIFESKNYKKIVRFSQSDSENAIVKAIEDAIFIDLNIPKEDDVENILPEDDVESMSLEDMEFIDFSCPNCDEIGSYPRQMYKNGAIFKCPFCEKSFKITKGTKENSVNVESTSDINDNREQEIEDLEETYEIYNFFPESDIYSPLFQNIEEAPEKLYRLISKADKYRYKPYIVSGKVLETFTDIFQAAEYFGVSSVEDEEVTYFNSFVVENEFGRMWICDFATVDINTILNRMRLGNVEEQNNKLINEFGGYDKSEYPRKDSDVEVLGLYLGYNKRYDVAICYFGINEYYYEWCLEEG